MMDRDEQVVNCLSLAIPELSLLPQSAKNQVRQLHHAETVAGSSRVFFKVGATGFEPV
jgi:hypothetical protein